MAPGELEAFTWFGVVTFLALNGFAAGVAAAFYAWRRAISRWGRIFYSAGMAGLLPASIMILAVVNPDQYPIEDRIWIFPAACLIFSVGFVASVPGAWIITRKLEQPGDEFRAFE